MCYEAARAESKGIVHGCHGTMVGEKSSDTAYKFYLPRKVRIGRILPYPPVEVTSMAFEQVVI